MQNRIDFWRDTPTLLDTTYLQAMSLTLNGRDRKSLVRVKLTSTLLGRDVRTPSP